MQQHPDYKYRPRRKPKPLVKSPTANGHTNGSHHNGNSANNTSSHHHHHNHHHSSNSNSSGSGGNNNIVSNNNNNNNDSRSSNNNLHSNHHHSLKSTSPSIIASHLHPHHHPSKYSFVPTIELPISFPPSQHSQQQAVFPSGIHYPLVDPTLALDLQARLHAMYMNAYYPWRLPLISSTTPTSSSPPPPSSGTNHYASSPKISPTTTTTNSPPLEPDTQTIIWPTPLRYHNAEWISEEDDLNFNEFWSHTPNTYTHLV